MKPRLSEYLKRGNATTGDVHEFKVVSFKY